MNKEIAIYLQSILINKGIKFISLYGGLVRTGTIKEKEKQKFPISEKYYHNGKEYNNQIILTPNNREKGILYFEDNGIKAENKRLSGGFDLYKSQLRLICWINKKNIVKDQTKELESLLVSEIINSLTPICNENYLNIIISDVAINAIPEINEGLFSRYTYNQEETQYLRPPFIYFGIDLNVYFYSKQFCVTSIDIDKDLKPC